MKVNHTLLDLLLEVQSLDRVARSGYVLRGVADPESVTEHTCTCSCWSGRWDRGSRGSTSIGRWRSPWCTTSPSCGSAICRAPPPTTSPTGAKNAAEIRGHGGHPRARRRARRSPSTRSTSRATTPEARLVKACDKLQLMLKVAVYERWGTGALAEFWDNPDNFPDGGFPAVRELFEALRERRNAGARL